jgi:hypothetical protein
MAFTYDAPDDLNNESQFLKDEGVFHLAVINAEEEAKYKRGDKAGQFRNGFALEFEVLTPGPHQKKMVEVFGRSPSLNHKDKGEFCRKVQGRILEAIAVINPSHYGKQATVELVRQDGDKSIVTVMGRQCIAKFKKNEDGYLELDGANIWHIDDPSAEKCERLTSAIDLLPKSVRRSADSFAKTAAANGAPAGGQTPAAAPASLDDL